MYDHFNKIFCYWQTPHSCVYILCEGSSVSKQMCVLVYGSVYVCVQRILQVIR